MPLLMAAPRIASSRGTEKLTPEGWTVTVKAMGSKRESRSLMSTAIVPARHRPSLLIVGCGDVGLRVLRNLSRGWRVHVLTSSPERRAELRALGAVPLLGDLDDPRTLGRLGGLADTVLHLAPPPASGTQDTRTRHLVRALLRG